MVIHVMKKQFHLSGLVLAGLLAGAGALRAQTVSVTFSTMGKPVNLQSATGVPISSTVNTNIGSNGRMVLGADLIPPTTNQFASLLSYGGVLARPDWTNLTNSANAPLLRGTNAFSLAVAKAMGLPMGSNGVVIVQSGAQIGASFIISPVSYNFCSVISPPFVDENSVLLTNSPTAYWQSVPWSASNHTNDPYYYSPNAGQVFATQPGQIQITWVTAKSFPVGTASGYVNPGGTPSFYTNGSSVFLLYTASYIVSGVPVKTPQNMFWTEGSFVNLGHPIPVSGGRITAINVIFNSSFPEFVTTPYVDPTQSVSSNSISETRTLWFDAGQKLIHAYNAQGQVFVELLGAPNAANNNSQFLGFEIVNVAMSATPVNVAIPLGNQLTPFSDGFQGQSLTPSPLAGTGPSYTYLSGSVDNLVYYADRFTPDQNDLLVYWLTTGVGGLQWPQQLVNYYLYWPSDPAQYSWYLRPNVATSVQAALTAIPLNQAEGPVIDYQDPLDTTRGFITGNTCYYSWLTPAQPAHRALLRFNSGGNVRFERVFSYLAEGIQNPALISGSVLTNLTAWNPANGTFTNFASGYNPPYVINQTVTVGQRISPPAGELGSTNGTYWAGWINTNVDSAGILLTNEMSDGLAYNPQAYIDPLASGFAAANRGAIIPVNAIPGENSLQVWWFRSNEADPAMGFQPVYWPSVIGRYTIQWPTNAPQIVLANNAGTGPLSGPAASGQIYYQNDPAQPGYNPNEEHAVMLGGQAYALRTDLNQTAATNSALPFGGYSSAPFVLLGYTDGDGRPSMRVYGVLREIPEAGQAFDYVVTAGQMVQAPMPLPLLPLPLAPNASYPNGFTNYNRPPATTGNDLPRWWTPALATNAEYARYAGFTFQDRNNNFWVYRGLNAGLPKLEAAYYVQTSDVFADIYAVGADRNQPFIEYFTVSRLMTSITVGVSNLPPGLAVTKVDNGLMISGRPTTIGDYIYVLTLTDSDGSQFQLSQWIAVMEAGGGQNQYKQLVMVSTNQYAGNVVTFSNRPPFLAKPANSNNCFTMNFYYKTLPGFAWPELGATNNWPAVGTIVPYLRPSSTLGIAGSETNCNLPSLPIVYRPVWPQLGSDGVSPLPSLALGQTLTTAVNGLTAIRGQDSVQILYQQAIATNSVLTNTAASVTLYDPTSQKKSSLSTLLPGGLPSSIVTDPALGLYYFPNLPANLISRVWFDPQQNALIFQGQFVADPVNGDYLMLNVLRGNDLAAVNGLCSASDPNYANWTNVVGNLSTSQYTFGNDANRNYVIQTNLTLKRGAGDLLEVKSSDTAADSYALSAVGPKSGYISYVAQNDLNPKLAGDPVSVVIVRVSTNLFQGSLVIANAANASPFSQMTTFQHTADLAGQTGNYIYDWRIASPGANGAAPVNTPVNWPGPYLQTFPGPVYTLGAAGIQGLSDNYVSMRYGYTNNGALVWSPWANPLFVPGWIKRVTQSLDPISGGTQNLLKNPANTTASLIALAGSRWNGNVPLNAAALTNSGLIQLYETVLNTGAGLSINSGINYGPANQALLLAAGYLNDFYTILGNDAWANSQNPTIGFGTSDTTYGSVATSSFVFEGQEPTLLQQNLALLRGRNDSVSPGVNVPPVYNHLWWNYTYGISAGETIYALNYNITDQNGDGVANAADASIMYPQGHGDAYGHYLTGLMDYVKLLMNPNFDWVPQAQVVSVLGASVAVNYQDEQKFASTAAALARTGGQIFGLTFREGYLPGTAGGWGRFATNYVGRNTYVDNTGQSQPITTYWGLDHWAARVGRGTYLNWVMGNSMLPPVDTNPNNQGIQKVDRTTVTALQELPLTAAALETDMDNANAGFTPLGLAQNAVPFDINPGQVTGSTPQTHFEQIYARAVQALNNAVVAFNAAQNVTTDLRRQQNSLTALKNAVTSQEQAYNNQLIELYGTPYPDDMGAGQTYPQGYTGPDLLHYMYVEGYPTNTFGGSVANPAVEQTFQIDTQQFPADWLSKLYSNFDFNTSATAVNYNQNTNSIAYNISASGFSKPSGWSSQRGSVGSIQTAIAKVQTDHANLLQACAGAVSDKQNLDQSVALFKAQNLINTTNLDLQDQINSHQKDYNHLATAQTILNTWYANYMSLSGLFYGVAKDSFPSQVIVGLAIGGDPAKAFWGLVGGALMVAPAVAAAANSIETTALQSAMVADQKKMLDLQQEIAVNQNNSSILSAVQSLGQQMDQIQRNMFTINQARMALQGDQAAYQTLVARGNRLQQERLTFRQQTAAQVQGDTVANAAFLVFQNEDLQRYNTLFNLAAEYAYMAANAFDYETGLLGTPAGQSYLNQIISSCALGIVDSRGQPQISGSTTGDPGLANALAEMKGDFDVLKGRLGFNNPDGYGTIVSLRSENYRINPDSTGDNNWKQVLQQGLMADLRTDPDVLNNCLQIDNGSGQAVPGIVLTFSTTITDGQNLFGQLAGPGDHAFSASSFATKIFSMGVCLDGYVGMDNPVSNSGAGGTSPSDPTLNPNGLVATPYVYLIPCGADSMRSPPLGDSSAIRTWNVDDVAIPLPYNIGASSFSEAPFYQAANSLTEPLFAVRKQQAFRPVSSLQAFNTSIYGATGSLQPSQYTNQRLIGRSVWNSKWKLIIPGKTLLADPNQGLARFINSVKDIHLYLVTYSYAGN